VVSISGIAYETLRSFVKFSGEHAIKLKFRQHFKNEVTSSNKNYVWNVHFCEKTVLNDTNFFDVDENYWFLNFCPPPPKEGGGGGGAGEGRGGGGYVTF
jgi:hypothetical protein